MLNCFDIFDASKTCLNVEETLAFLLSVWRSFSKGNKSAVAETWRTQVPASISRPRQHTPDMVTLFYLLTFSNISCRFSNLWRKYVKILCTPQCFLGSVVFQREQASFSKAQEVPDLTAIRKEHQQNAKVWNTFNAFRKPILRNVRHFDDKKCKKFSWKSRSAKSHQNFQSSVSWSLHRTRASCSGHSGHEKVHCFTAPSFVSLLDQTSSRVLSLASKHKSEYSDVLTTWRSTETQ